MVKTVLVTGARGLVGGRLIDLLRGRRDVRAIGLTRSADHTGSDGNISFAAVDWQNQGGLEEACQGVDAIIHLAAMNEPDGEAAPERALLDNGMATLRLVNAARLGGVSRFIYVSTAKVYGLNLQGTVTEDTPARPLNHYAITHHVAEDYVLAAHAQGTFEGCVFRLSNGVGYPSDPHTHCWMLIANSFCLQAVRDRRITLSGSGVQWRNFIPLADVAGALAFGLDVKGADLGDGLFNLGGPSPMRIIDMAESVAGRCEALFGHRPEIQCQQNGAAGGDPMLYDCTKLGRLGFRSRTPLSDEIDGILRMCRSEAFLKDGRA